MKKFYLFFILIMTLTSCSSDDGNVQSNSNSQIIGTWGAEFINDNDYPIDPKFTFLSNGDVKYYTYFNPEPELEEIGTWNLSGDILTMEFPENVLIMYKNKVTFVSDSEIYFEEVNETGYSTWDARAYFKTDDPNLN